MTVQHCSHCNRIMVKRVELNSLKYGIKESTGELHTFDGTVCGICLTQAGYLSLSYVSRLLIKYVTGITT